jgi:hypothetical protein
MKNHHHHNPIHPKLTTAAAPAPSHEAIARRAHGLWEAQGHPANCDEANWLEAERQLVTSPGPAQPGLALSTDS